MIYLDNLQLLFCVEAFYKMWRLIINVSNPTVAVTTCSLFNIDTGDRNDIKPFKYFEEDNHILECKLCANNDTVYLFNASDIKYIQINMISIKMNDGHYQLMIQSRILIHFGMMIN